MGATFSPINSSVSCAPWGACGCMLSTGLLMIDATDTSRPSHDQDGEEGLEEARLRQQAIGVKLRHLFDEVVNEPVPDEFLEILRRADGASGGSSK